MKVDNEKRRGVSYLKRVADINRIYDHWSRTGLSNREIWRRYIYPVYGISERTLYYMLKARSDEESVSRKGHVPVELYLFPELSNADEELRTPNYWRKRK